MLVLVNYVYGCVGLMRDRRCQQAARAAMRVALVTYNTLPSQVCSKLRCATHRRAE